MENSRNVTNLSELSGDKHGTTGLFRTEGHESPLKVAVSNAQARASSRIID